MNKKSITIGLFTVCLLLAILFTQAHAKSDLLQFTSGGHILGFKESSMLLASGTHMLKVDFVGGKPVTPVSPDTPSDKARPLTKVTYPKVWDGIDVAYESSKNSVAKSTYTVSPGSNPSTIRLHHNRPLALDKNGNLVTTYDTGRITQSRPTAWQVKDGKRKPVMVAYNLQSNNDVGFTVGNYDSSLPLVIEPSFAWNTFLGGNGQDHGNAIAVDASGNVYVTGDSYGAAWGDNPIRPFTEFTDAFIAKLTTDGTLVWHTFLGGNGDESGNAIVVDSSGNIYVAGNSDATWGDNPVRPYTLFLDAFIAKLTTDGTLVWHTFLGGSSNDCGNAIAVDSSGNVYVAGWSDDTWGDNPVRPHKSYSDAFVAKLTPSGALTWNTFLGGGGSDSAWGIAVDSSGNVYVAGMSEAPWGSNPVRPYSKSDSDAFVAKLTANGSLAWHTFLGGKGSDHGHAIAVDSSGNVYVAGRSYAKWGVNPIRPFTPASDAFAARLTTKGALVWHTFLGGSGGDNGTAIAVDSSGNVYVAGLSSAMWGDNPIRPYTLGYDAFVARLTASGHLNWNAFLGGSGVEFGNAIAVDSSTNVYVAGNSYDATWGDSPIRPYTTNTDAFVAKINGGSIPCSYTLTSASKTLPYTKASTTVIVNAQGTDCQTPAVTPNDTWITAPKITKIKKNKWEAKIAVSKNTVHAERTGTVTIEGNNFDVTQKPAPCTLSISPMRDVFESAGGTDSFTVTATTGCEWTVEVGSGASTWLSATPITGTATAPVSYTAIPNSSTKKLTGKITVYLTEIPAKKQVFTVIERP